MLDGRIEFPPTKRQNERKPFEELAAHILFPVRQTGTSPGNILSKLGGSMHPLSTNFTIGDRCTRTIIGRIRASCFARNVHGKVEGASCVSTIYESRFRPCLGNKLTAWFSIGDLGEAKTVVAVESPIEALSLPHTFLRTT